jgi:hypothetical protein
LAFKNRDAFVTTMLSKLTQMCELREPTKEVLSLFETLPNSFRREAVPRALAAQFQPKSGILYDWPKLVWAKVCTPQS